MLDPHAAAEPLDLGRALILFGAHAQKFKVAVEGKQPVFVVGLKPRQNYLIEVDDEEMSRGTDGPGRHPGDWMCRTIAKWACGSAL